MERSLSIGSSGKNQLTIDGTPSVSDQHAKILNQGDTFLLKDLGSKHGTFVNGQRITQRQIACGDKFAIGAVEFEVLDPMAELEDAASETQYWSLIADSSWLSGQEFPIKAELNSTISLGRGSQCDIVFPGTHLSRRHAEITIHYSSLHIRDTGSANGTFVNDKKVDEATLYPGDHLRLDVYSFRLFGPGIQLPKSSTSVHKPVPSQAAPSSNKPKRWKSKPTSVGNREELNLYKKDYRAPIWAAVVLLGLAGAIAYIFLGLDPK